MENAKGCPRVTKSHVVKKRVAKTIGRSELQDQRYRQIRRGRLAEQICDDLANNILSGTLARGTKLQTEREIAEGYGVSGPTVREAIRALAAMRLLEVRHGSGAYVTADCEQIVATALRSTIQIEGLGVLDVLGVLGILNSAAAEFAAARATKGEVEALREANNRVASGADIESIVAGLKDFHFTLATASHNPLLAALCKFLISLQMELAQELAGGSLDAWLNTTRRLASDRGRLIDAIATKDADLARESSRTYHEHALAVILKLPNANAARKADPMLARLMASLVTRTTAQSSKVFAKT